MLFIDSCRKSYCYHFSAVMPPYLSWSEGFESSDGDLVIGADLVVV